MLSDWRFALSSVAGTSHQIHGQECQDCSACGVVPDVLGDPVLISVAADGAGSAEFASCGSNLACRLLIDEITRFLTDGGTVCAIENDFLVSAVHKFQREVLWRATELGVSSYSFACTLLGAIIGQQHAVFFQIGDGAIVVSSRNDPDGYGWIFWPMTGEYENTTVFATDDGAPEMLRVECTDRVYDELAIFTDGIQRLVLDYREFSAHIPFFRATFRPLRTELPGYLEQLSDHLNRYLNSPKVIARTNDDKTLILATRRAEQDARGHLPSDAK